MTEETTELSEQSEPGHPLAERLSRPSTVLTVGVVAFTLLGFVAGFLVNDLTGRGPSHPGGDVGFSQHLDGPGGPKGPMLDGPHAEKQSGANTAPTTGEVKSIDGNTVTLETPDGRTAKVNLKSGMGIAILP